MTAEHIVVGSVMLVVSSTCLLANFAVLATIAMNSEFSILSSYKIMLLMGVFDVSQLCSHFATGIFTIIQFEAPHWLYKFLGTILSPSYECYVFVTILLSFNRFLFMCSPFKETIVFSTLGNKIWLLLTTLIFAGFAGIHLSDRIYSYYDVFEYKWTYDHSYAWSGPRETAIFYYQVLGIFIAWVFYILITINLLRYKNRVDSVTRFYANRNILLHAFVITVYSTLMNIAWHKIDLILATGNTQNFVINLTWIGSAGLSPFMCLVLNKRIRRKITNGVIGKLFPSTKVHLLAAFTMYSIKNFGNLPDRPSLADFEGSYSYSTATPNGTPPPAYGSQYEAGCDGYLRTLAQIGSNEIRKSLKEALRQLSATDSQRTCSLDENPYEYCHLPLPEPPKPPEKRRTVGIIVFAVVATVILVLFIFLAFNLYFVAPRAPIDTPRAKVEVQNATFADSSDDDLSYCDPPWGYFPKTRSCFRFYETRVSYDDAVNTCTQQKGHLASIHSAEENQFVVGFVSKQLPGNGLSAQRIGAYIEDEFAWLDGTKWDYDHWIDDNAMPPGHCVEIMTYNDETLWNRAPCEWWRSFICKRAADRKPT